MKYDESESPLRHALHTAHDEVEQLIDVAERGESTATPAVIAGGVAVIVIALIATFIAIAAAVGYLVSGSPLS